MMLCFKLHIIQYHISSRLFLDVDKREKVNKYMKMIFDLLYSVTDVTIPFREKAHENLDNLMITELK